MRKIELPELGLTTWSKDCDEDEQVARQEAFEYFCLVAEKFGDGVIEERKKVKNDG